MKAADVRSMLDNPELARVPFDVAERLPPAWDSVEHRQRIYSTFERLQICIWCGNTRQSASLMASLQRLTNEAVLRREALLGIGSVVWDEAVV